MGRKNKTYTNVSRLVPDKTSLTVKLGETATVKTTIVLVDKKKKLTGKDHAATFRYATNDPYTATVDKNGNIKGVTPGKCKVYVYAKNGNAKAITVNVKK